MNEKKLFSEKKPIKKSLMEFVEKKGFYVVLVLCVVIVGAAAVLLSIRGTSSPNTDLDSKMIPDTTHTASAVPGDKSNTPQSSVTTPAVPDIPKVAVNAPVGKTAEQPIAKETDKSKDKDKKPADTAKKPAAAPKPAAKVEKFIRPVFGDVSFAFAQDKLVYSKTLDEWRTHSGMDIAADLGTPVKAVADGVVSDVKNDPRFGILVIIDHQNGIKTVYANLASDDVVTPNQKIKQGDVIGSIGSTAAVETIEQTHLHFEVWKENKPVNPATYLP